MVDGKAYASSAGPPYDLFRKAEVVAAWSAVTDSTYGRTDTSQGPARWLAVPVREGSGPDGVFVVAQFYGPQQQDITNATRIVAIVMAATLLLATLLGWLAAGRALAPIGRLERAARRAGIDDLTERLPVTGDDEVARLTQTFNDLLARLESSVLTQRRFVSDMGHDLRTPITIVRGQLELLPDDPDERAAVLALCMDELDRMGRYVRDLSLLANATQPSFLEPGAVDLDALTHGIAQRARRHRRHPHLDRRRRSRPPSSRVTATASRRAWLNLVTNAVAHTPPGSPVSIGSSLGPDGVRLWVADHGAGVDAAGPGARLRPVRARRRRRRASARRHRARPVDRAGHRRRARRACDRGAEPAERSRVRHDDAAPPSSSPNDPTAPTATTRATPPSTEHA